MSLERQRWGLFWIAFAMAGHALVIGRILESPFFIATFTWGWVAVAALRNNLQSARSMILTMVILFGVAIVAAGLILKDEHIQAYYSLALMPAMVANVCMLYYIRFLDQNGVTGETRYTSGRQEISRLTRAPQPRQRAAIDHGLAFSKPRL